MLVWVESFESDEYISKKTATGTHVSSPAGGQVSQARTGSYGFVGSARYLIYLSASEQDDYFVLGRAFSAQSPATAGAVAVFYGDAGATPHVTVWMDVASGGLVTFSVYRGDHATGVLLGSVAITRPSLWFTWSFIEVAARLSDTVGTVDIWLDDTNILTLSGIDTKNGGSATVFDTIESGGPGNYGIIDDLYLVNEQGSINNSRLGPVRIFAEVPNGNGASSQGVGSDGNSIDNYQVVGDFVPANMGSSNANNSYVDLQNTGDKDTYAFTNIAFAGVSAASPVKGVFVWAVAEKTDAGARGLQLVSHLSGSEDTHDYPALVNLSFGIAGVSFETKPGGGAWTVDDVNNAEFGIVAT